MRLDMVRRELAQGAEIVTALSVGVSPEEATVRPAPGAWSLLEVIGHLLDEERLDFRPRLDLVLHRPDEAWAPIDPEAWVIEHQYNARELADVRTDHRRRPARLLGRARSAAHAPAPGATPGPPARPHRAAPYPVRG